MKMKTILLLFLLASITADTNSQIFTTDVSTTKFKPGRLVAKCGSLYYTSRQKICCGDRLLNRTGIQPACCAFHQYDAMFDVCCKGKIIHKSRGVFNC